MSMNVVDSADYIVVGGGLTGLTLAQRLSKRIPDASILVIEAGEHPRQHPEVLTFSGLLELQKPECNANWNLKTLPSRTLNDRMIWGQAGKGLGGSGNINAGIWLRGNAVDYDTWAKVVQDDAWSYVGMLPYLKMVENVQDECRNKEQHGFDGYIKVCQVHEKSPRKGGPLREPLKQAFSEVGVPYIGDPNTGSQNGVHNHSDAWVDGNRQLLVDVLDLSRVRIMTGTPVHRIKLEQRGDDCVAIGVELEEGRFVKASKEVILSAGAYQSPKLLMLSGIGDSTALSSVGIATKISSPEVGLNLSDHLGMCLQWKVKHPERGMAMGSPLFNDPSYFAGYPVELVFHGAVEEPKALSRLIHKDIDRDIIMRPGGSHIEVFFQSLPMGPEADAMGLYPNGEYISTVSLCLAPASRGYVKLGSSDPLDSPIIDRNFNHEEADLYVHREAMRMLARVLLDTEAGKDIIEKEVAPTGSPLVTADATDEELNQRIRSGTFSISHPMGTAAMGKVVDSRCRVNGVKGLRVVDASVLPIPHGAPPQPLLYALAEKMAHFISTGE